MYGCLGYKRTQDEVEVLRIRETSACLSMPANSEWLALPPPIGNQQQSLLVAHAVHGRITNDKVCIDKDLLPALTTHSINPIITKKQSHHPAFSQRVSAFSPRTLLRLAQVLSTYQVRRSIVIPKHSTRGRLKAGATENARI